VSRPRFLALAALVLCLSLGGATVAEASHRASFNPTDARFAQKMRPHHLQAVRMAREEIARGSDPQVKALAVSIMVSQTKEAAQLHRFIRTFGQRQQPAPRDQQARWDQNFREMQVSSAERADVVFLTNMVPHHGAAIPMAQLELERGEYRPAQRLARKIKGTQLLEISLMKAALRERALR